MSKKLNKLESQQSEILGKVSKEDYIAWKSSAFTKALILQLQIDAQEVKDNWMSGRYGPEQVELARGAGIYADTLEHETIPSLNPEERVFDD